VHTEGIDLFIQGDDQFTADTPTERRLLSKDKTVYCSRHFIQPREILNVAGVAVMAREIQPDQKGHGSEAELAGLRGGLTKEVILLLLLLLVVGEWSLTIA
jgi:hypothetical protein